MENEETRKDFSTRRKMRLGDIHNSLGISTGDADAIRKTFGEGMEAGTVQFEPDSEGGGTLRTTITNRHGQQQDIERKVDPGSEAVFLAGLQAEINSRKS